MLWRADPAPPPRGGTPLTEGVFRHVAHAHVPHARVILPLSGASQDPEGVV